MAADGGMETVRRVVDLRARLRSWRAQGETVGLVPTMGGLHEGHLSLVRASLAAAGRTVVTLFVNPAQFGEGEDFDDYPRDEAADAGLLAGLGAHLLFAPEGDEIYPQGHVTRVSVPGIGDRLEGEFRPDFFTGVATVVSKLLIQALPDMAFFGEKDYQQLRVITQLARDLDIPTDILGVATVREDDGLALSSRNAYLGPGNGAWRRPYTGSSAPSPPPSPRVRPPPSGPPGGRANSPVPVSTGWTTWRCVTPSP